MVKKQEVLEPRPPGNSRAGPHSYEFGFYSEHDQKLLEGPNPLHLKAISTYCVENG